MKLLSSVELIETAKDLKEERSHDASPLNASCNILIHKTDRMMKETGGESAVVLSSKDYPNGQIKKTESLNGVLTKGSPLKKIFEATKVPFDMTVKKVTIPVQWEKFGLSSSEDKAESQKRESKNGFLHKDNESLVLAEEVQKNNDESLGSDFVDDNEKIGLSDSEVDKLLEDVDGSGGEDSNVKSSSKEENGVDHSENDTWYDSKTTPGGEDLSGALNKLPDLKLKNNEKPETDSAKTNDCNSNSTNLEKSSGDKDKTEVTNNDAKEANITISTLKENSLDTEMTDVSQEKTDMLEKCTENVGNTSDESQQSVSEDEALKPEENKLDTTNFEDITESSHFSEDSSSKIEENVVLSKTEEKHNSSSCDENLIESEETELSEKSEGVESHIIETESSKVDDDKLPEESVEPCEKSDIDVLDGESNEGLCDTEVSSDKFEEVESLDDVEMKDCENEETNKSDDSEKQTDGDINSDKSLSNELSVDSKLEDMIDENESSETNNMSTILDDDDDDDDDDDKSGVDGDDEYDHSSKKVKLTEYEEDSNSKLNSNSKNVDEDSILMSSETEDSTSGNDKTIVEPELEEEKGEAERLVRKRSSNLKSDHEIERKRTKTEESDSKDIENDSKCNDSVECESEANVRTHEKEEKEDKCKSEHEKELETKDFEKENKDNQFDNKESDSQVNDRDAKDEQVRYEDISKVEKKDQEKNNKDIEGSEKEQDKFDLLISKDINTSVKRVHEPVGLIEVKKVRISPEVEKQLKESISIAGKAKDEKKKATAEKKESENQEASKKIVDVDVEKEEVGVEKKEVGVEKDEVDVEKEEVDKKSEEKEGDKEKAQPDKSAPLTEPKSNLDLAIERVATGVVEEEPPKKLNPMPFMRDLQTNLLKKLTRNDLEELVVQKLCEAVTDRCNLGEMRQKCQNLEQIVDHWRKKAQQLQKQLKDMEMVMKRYIGDARSRKERPIPVKITRSVGLQVLMGGPGPIMRNRQVPNESVRTQQPPPLSVRRRVNNATNNSRVSSPTTASTQQPQSQQTQQSTTGQQSATQQLQPQTQTQQTTTQQRPSQPIVRASTTPLTVQKVVTPGFTKIQPAPTVSSQSVTSRQSVTALVTSTPSTIKIGPAPAKNPVGRPPTITTTAATATGSTTSTVNTVNSTIVNTSNNLRIATATQLNNRQQPAKQGTTFTPKKVGSDPKVIDLIDEEEKAISTTAGILRPLNSATTTIPTNLISTSNLIPSSSVSTVSIASNSGIQTGSIRVVQPHQLTGSTTTTLLGPTTPSSGTPRVAYFVPTSGGSVQQRQVLIASSASQVRPGVMNVSSRQNQLPTLVFKNGTVVPIQQASGQQVRTAPVSTTAILRPGPSVQTNQLQQVISPARAGQQIRVTPNLVTTVGRMASPSVSTVNPVIGNKHPAPLPNPPVYQPTNVNWKFPPPKPELKISKVANKHQQGIVLSWNMQLTSEYEEIASYQLYAYQEGSAQPSTSLWKKVGDVKALPLPMACTLTQFMEGHKYHFAVRAVDVHSRVGPFSVPGNIVLTRK